MALENTHSHKKTQDRKPAAPPVVAAQKAGLHPLSKTAQGLMGANKKKGT